MTDSLFVENIFEPEAEPKSAMTVVRLSELLKPIPGTELALILERYMEAIRDGTIAAVPHPGQRFTRTYIDPQTGQKRKRTLTDESILLTSAVTTWIMDCRRKVRYQNMIRTGRVETTDERLASGEDDFDHLVALRRQILKKKARDQKAQRQEGT